MLARRLIVGGVATFPAEDEVFHGVRAFHSTTQSLTNNVHNVVDLNSEEYDTDAYHSTVTNNSRLTVPTGLAGYYHIFGAVSIEGSAGGQRLVIVCKNATDIEGGTDFGDILVPVAESAMTGAAGNAHLVFSVVRPLAESDYVQMAVYQNCGSTLDLDVGSEAGDYVPSFGMEFRGAL